MGSRAGFFAALLTLVTSAGVGAQIDGSVTDPFGNPVPNALVELMVDGQGVERTETDAFGRFSLKAHSRARRVQVSALGFQTAFAALDNLMEPLRIVLEERVTELAALQVQSERSLCPIEGGRREGLQLWQDVRRNYEMPPEGSVWRVQVLERRRGETRLRDFGNLEDDTPAWAELGAREQLLDHQRQIVKELGFARRTQWSQLRGREEAWDYPELGSVHAHLFVDEVFASSHQFQAQDDGETLVFCPIDQDVPALRGQMLLTSSRKIEKIVWQFVTPEPVEEAGGEVIFDPNGTYLLPLRHLFWRKSRMNRVYQELERFGPWLLGDRDEVAAGIRRFRSAAHEK